MLRIVERVNIRTTTLIRAVILTSIVGHWVANALFDRDQYAGAGSELLTRLDDPFLVQAAIGLLAVALLSIRDRRLDEHPHVSLGRLPLAALLVGLQLLFFLGLESSERLVVDLLAGEAADVLVFGSGFVAELVVAVGSAILLTLVAEATKRLLKVLRPEELPAGREQGSQLSLGFAHAVGVKGTFSLARRPDQRRCSIAGPCCSLSSTCCSAA